MKSLYHYLDRHPMWHTLFSLRGNARACLYPEPLWGIPYSLFAPFATLYMYHLGVGDQQIGLILSISMVFQMIFSLLGGVIVDKFGRKPVTLWVDIIAWSIPTLIWAFSQNFWWFLVAHIIYSTWQITNNSWNCLMVEDTDPKLLVHIYTWCTISGLISVFLAPVSGLMVARWGVVPVVRGLYLFAFVCMTAKFILVNALASETQQGIKRKAETKGVPIYRLLSGYGGIFKRMLSAPHTRLALAIVVLLNITAMVSGTFFPLYLTQNLDIPEAFLSYYPILRSVVMLIFIFSVQHRVDRLPFRIPMGVGLVLYTVAQGVLLLTPPMGYGLLVVVILAEAFGVALVMPRRDSLLATYVNPQERARMLGLVYVTSMACTSPFGWLAGWLAEINRALPFVLNLVLYAVLTLMIIFSKTMRERADTEQHS